MPDGMSEIEHVYQSIRARRAEIQRLRIALDQEDAELAATERNVARFLPNSPTPPREIPTAAPISTFVAKVMEEIAPTPKRGERKPNGIPTIFKMSCDALREAAARGHPWLDSREIAEFIRKRWWPEVEPGFIQPQLWRAAEKRKVLMKDGARYALPNTPKEKGPTGATAEPSLSNGAEATVWPTASVPAGVVEGSASAALATHQPRT